MTLIVLQQYEMRCAIWYYLYNFKNVKSTHRGKLFLVQILACISLMYITYIRYAIFWYIRYVDITKVGLPQASLVSINQSLCSYYKYLWSLWKRLHSKKLMHSFWVSNCNVNLKVRENTPVLLVSYVIDLEKHFDIKGLIVAAEG